VAAKNKLGLINRAKRKRLNSTSIGGVCGKHFVTRNGGKFNIPDKTENAEVMKEIRDGKWRRRK
jgi:hypothetical protein